jgi:outer membrane protein assembly factor BamB
VTVKACSRLTLFARAVRLGPLVASALAVACGGGSTFNSQGNILIADQFNNRIIELDPSSGTIVWTFGDGSSMPGPSSIVGPNDAERVGTQTLIAGTGAPPGTPTTYEASCFDNGCADNRVILVDQAGKIVWQYGQAGVTGSDANELDAPVQATYLPNKDVLITDQGNARVIEVDSGGHIVWQYGTTGVTGSDPNQLNDPNSAQLLTNGDILIADEGNNRVIEVNRQQQIVWQYAPNDTTKLDGAAFASRLDSGNTLITDSNNNRVIEIDASGNVVFSYVTTSRSGSMQSPLPTRAIRLSDGNTLISDQYNDQVIEVDSKGSVVFSYGQVDVVGKSPGLLNAPYDAKVIGQYVGLTSPQ